MTLVSYDTYVKKRKQTIDYRRPLLQKSLKGKHWLSHEVARFLAVACWDVSLTSDSSTKPSKTLSINDGITANTFMLKSIIWFTRKKTIKISTKNKLFADEPLTFWTQLLDTISLNLQFLRNAHMHRPLFDVEVRLLHRSLHLFCKPGRSFHWMPFV